MVNGEDNALKVGYSWWKDFGKISKGLDKICEGWLEAGCKRALGDEKDVFFGMIIGWGKVSFVILLVLFVISKIKKLRLMRWVNGGMVLVS